MITAALYVDRIRMLNWQQYRPLVMVQNLAQFALCVWVVSRIGMGESSLEGSILSVGVCLLNYINSYRTWAGHPPMYAMKPGEQLKAMKANQ